MTVVWNKNREGSYTYKTSFQKEDLNQSPLVRLRSELSKTNTTLFVTFSEVPKEHDNFLQNLSEKPQGLAFPSYIHSFTLLIPLLFI